MRAYRQSAPVLALLPPGHPLASAGSVTLAQMAATRWPCPAETTVRQMIDIVCSRQGPV